jgi:hypothetical protein
MIIHLSHSLPCSCINIPTLAHGTIPTPALHVPELAMMATSQGRQLPHPAPLKQALPMRKEQMALVPLPSPLEPILEEPTWTETSRPLPPQLE